MSSYLSHRRKGFQGGVTAFDGFGNRSRSFNGVSDYVDLGDSDDFSFGDGINDSPFSVSAWIKMEDASQFRIITKFNISSTEQEWQFSFGSDNKLYFSLYSDNGASRLTRGTSMTFNSLEGQWVHVTATYDGSSSSSGIKIYKTEQDGLTVRVDASTFNIGSYISMHNTSASAIIGRLGDWTGGANYADGNIADVRIYDAELSSSDVSDLYAGTNVTTNLAGHWLTDADDTEDKAGSNNGTNYGSKYSYDNPSPAVEFGSASRIFDGTSDYITVQDGSWIPTGAQTWACWIKPDADAIVTFFNHNVGTGNQRSVNIITYTGGVIYAQISPNGITTTDAASPSSTYVAGEWIHVAFTFAPSSSTGLKLYINGSLETTSNVSSISSVHNSTADIGIGANGLGQAPFQGNICDCRIYDTDLTASQISDLYAGTDVQTNLVAHYLTDNDDVEDKAGTNDGTNFGSTYSYEAPLPANKLIDTYASACGAYSLRELTTTWAGQNVVDVRRVSDGAISSFTSAEITNGTLASFCGTTGGFVSKVYDQSGNGFDLIQPTEGDQPQIYTGITQTVSTDNGLPCLDFFGGYLYNANSFDYEGGVSWYSVINASSSSSSRVWCDDITGVQGYVNFYYNSYNLNDGAGYEIHSVNGATTNQQLRSYNFDESQGSYNYGFNGSSINGSFGVWGGSIETNGSSNIGVMGSGNGTQNTIGLWQELIIYPNDQKHNKENIERNINEFYSIY